MRVTLHRPELILPADASRSGGLHVSDVIADAARALGVLKGAEGPDEYGEGRRLLMSLGSAWEAHIAPTVEGLVIHPGEVMIDGIAGSPDGLLPAQEADWECKLTRKSSGRDIRGEFMWLAQAKSYLKALGWRRAMLDVLHVNGNYKDVGIDRIVYELEFTRQEIEDNWTMLKRHAEGMR